MDFRRHLHISLLFIGILTYTRAQLPTFRTHPGQTTIIKGGTMTLKCRVTTEPAGNDIIQWYKNGDLLPVNNSIASRFLITGDQTQGEYDLTITDTELSDSGEYYCKIKEPESSSNIATVNVIEPDLAWYPSCVMHLRSASKTEESRLAESGFIKGDEVAIECKSYGTPLPDLTWREGDRTVPGQLMQDVNDSSVVNVFAWTLSEKDDGALYVCSASLPDLSNSPVCHIGPLDVRVKDDSDINMIPAIITGVLAGVAIILFGVVVILLFKYRQCKVCRDLPDFHDPVQVMMPGDPSQLPRPISSTDSTFSDEDDINVTVHVEDTDLPVQASETPPPVPQTDRPDLGKIGKSETIIRNINKDDMKPVASVTEKIPNIALLSKRDNDSQISSDTNDTVLNIQPEAGPSTSIEDSPSVPVKSPSLCTETPNVLELQEESIYYLPKRRDSKKDKNAKKKDRKLSKKNKFDKKQKKNPEYQDDKVVYAEINFSKNLGMNIIIDDEEKDSNVQN